MTKPKFFVDISKFLMASWNKICIDCCKHKTLFTAEYPCNVCAPFDLVCEACNELRIKQKKEKRPTRCKSCEYIKPKDFHCQTFIDETDCLICGYCSQSFERYIPKYLISIIQKYYIIKIQNTKLLNEAIGILFDNYERTYIWTFQVSSAKVLLQKHYIGINIEIGVKEIVEDDTDDTLYWEVEDDIDKPTILNNYTAKQKKYCPYIKVGDTITMILDYTNETLSYAVNDKYYGIFNNHINANKSYILHLNCTKNWVDINISKILIVPRIKRFIGSNALFTKRFDNK